jgi:hypothetical protein
VVHGCVGRLVEQDCRLMHPDPPKKQEELTEHVEMWRDKMRRLEAHGQEYKLWPVFKINALRMLMTGKAKEYFDLWEADRDTADAAKSHEELFAKVKEYARRRKLDSPVKKKMHHGGDPMDVVEVSGWCWYGGVSGDVYRDVSGELYAVGFEGKEKERGKGREIVRIVARPNIFPEFAPTRRRV